MTLPAFIVCGNKIYRRGTLAQRLDTRVCPCTEPQASDLPATINPMKFVLEHVFGSRLSIIRIRQQCIKSNIPFLFSLWKWFQTPEQLTLLVIEMTPVNENYTAIVSSSLDTWPALCNLSDTVIHTVLDEMSSIGACN